MAERRRLYGEGSVFSYDSRGVTKYRVQWFEHSVPGDPDSPRVRRTKGGFVNEKAAAKFAREAITGAENGKPVETQAPDTFGAFVQEWSKAHRVSRTTMSGYQRYLRLHILPTLGNKPITAITPRTLAALYRQLETDGRQDRQGGGLGPNTVRKVHALISLILEAAVEDRLLHSNPARMKSAAPPTVKDVKAARPKIVVWSPSQLTDFLTWAKDNDPDYYAAWHLLSKTGMRRSAACGLLWEHADFNRRELDLRRSVVTVKEKGHREYLHAKAPKNGVPQTMKISVSLASILRDERTRRALHRGLASVAGDQPMLITNWGTPVRPDGLTRRLVEAINRYNEAHPSATLPVFGPHGFRHTLASHLIAAGVKPHAVQGMLDHSTHAITMDLYVHLMDGDEQAALDTYERYIEQATYPETSGQADVVRLPGV